MTTEGSRTAGQIALAFGVMAVASIVFAACARTPITSEALLRQYLDTAGVTRLEAISSPAGLYDLGAALFFDPVLSGNRDVSCTTCHQPTLATVDAQSLAIGTGGVGRGDERQLGSAFLHVPRSSPDLFNRGDEQWHAFFWDGRVAVIDGALVTPASEALPDAVTSVQVAQAMITIASPIEMRGFAGDEDINGQLNELALFEPDEWELIWEATFSRLLEIEEYRTLLIAAYPDQSPQSLHLYHAVRALVAFQAEAFSSTNSPFDDFVEGDDSALTVAQLDGALLFFGSAGCSGCHSGPLLTDQGFYSIAAPQVGPGRGEVAPLDAGLGAVDGSGIIRFRTPPLRNVADTPPYLHDGAYWDLVGVIRHHLDPLGSLARYDSAGLRDDVAVDHLDRVAEAVAASLSQELIPRNLSDADILLIVAFLESLSDPTVLDLASLVPADVPSGLELYP